MVELIALRLGIYLRRGGTVPDCQEVRADSGGILAGVFMVGLGWRLELDCDGGQRT